MISTSSTSLLLIGLTSLIEYIIISFQDITILIIGFLIGLLRLVGYIMSILILRRVILLSIRRGLLITILGLIFHTLLISIIIILHWRFLNGVYRLIILSLLLGGRFFLFKLSIVFFLVLSIFLIKNFLFSRIRIVFSSILFLILLILVCESLVLWVITIDILFFRNIFLTSILLIAVISRVLLWLDINLILVRILFILSVHLRFLVLLGHNLSIS